MTYLIDSNIFIQAKNMYYRMKFCHAFWDLLLALHQKGKIYSINKVKQELLAGKDELSEWARTLPDSFWIDEEMYASEYGDVINWAFNHPQFTATAKQDFAEHARADAWLVATAQAKTMVIITHEAIASSNTKRIIKIPNAAQEFNVQCISIFDFLERNCYDNFKPL